MQEATNRVLQTHQELLTDEIHEVISYRPHWMVRKGNFLFLLVTLLLLGLTWIIQYPDKIEAPARLVALNPPKLVTAKTEGKIIQLFVSNEQAVQKGQILAHLESLGNYNVATRKNDLTYLDKQPLPEFSHLGELQTMYQQFQNELEITKQTLANGFYLQKKNALRKDLDYLATLKRNTIQQKDLLEQSKALDQVELKAYEKLAKEKVIAPLELNQYKEKMLANERGLKQANAQVTNTDISSHGKKKELLELEKLIADQHQQFYSLLLELKSETGKWMMQYALTAPEDGKVIFTSSLRENEWVGNGQGLFYVQPQQTSYYAELMAGQQGFGKVQKGQQVLVKVESYPETEFGYLQGTISHVSALAGRNDSFLVKVALPKGLQTNYGKNIFFRNNLVARSEIITDSRRLFDRMLGQLKTIWEK